MTAFDGSSPFPTTFIHSCLGDPLRSGQMGVLLARAGVGKTACLTLIALEGLARDEKVLHICIDELPDKIKIWYEELYRNFKNAVKDEAVLKGLKENMVSSRFIMSYLHHTFTPAKLEENLKSLRDQVLFTPTLIVLDGLDFERVSRKQLEAIQQTAKKYGTAVWFSCRIHRHIDITNDKGVPYPCHEVDDLFHAIVLLKPKAQGISMVVLKHGDIYPPEHAALVLNPRTFLVAQPQDNLPAQRSL
ncbi:DEAD/DEAH box helicase family protein [Desulfosoma caldarium]|uniref:Cytoplasmic protein n=1 Tax=Desulfosoma caldarium TaxID=610254 RepID=A0A3N1UHY3_9BACT|nr:DEAD/DEAH box helicase family protein [Desulfosoma caldarium]ROQ90875.1 hypothetical protein EDC27_2131 [Desulfosoma caldarium]